MAQVIQRPYPWNSESIPWGRRLRRRDMRKHGHCRLGIAGAVKMLIRKIEKEESNHDGHCDSHERSNS